MSKLKINDLKIQLPSDFNGDFDDAQFVEWIEWELGKRFDIKMTNPLIDISLKDCEVSIGSALLNDKPIII